MLIRPSFFEAGDFPFSAGLMNCWDGLRQAVLDRYLYLQFTHPHIYTTRNLGVVGQRGMFYLLMAGMKVQANRGRCPLTCRALELVPNLHNAAFYLLGPGCHILPHTGLCDRVLRAHLGLICPPDCALRIGTEQQCWRDGELMVFDDTLEHEAWNRSSRWRAVLSLDFFHPVPATAELQIHLAHHALNQKPAELAWYAAAGLELPAGLQLSEPGPSLRSMVDTHGLYFC
ncbi:aspartyl/asparaginyl beta-hydroxylase domain-containing protein [bacterium]|nr:aspartyl/asparaginyl beta-hydroxylase domain-containing protein [bacterium]